jgi:SAM-dependent methyltransferase
MEEVGCLFCRTSADPVLRAENGFTARRCARCGLIYLSPRPSEVEIAAMYDEGSAGGLTAADLARPDVTRTLIAMYTVKLIARHCPKGDILEIGAGGGQFLVEASRAGFRPHAVELAGPLVAYLSQTLGIATERRVAGRDDFFEGAAFDVIYHRNVLSHLYRPREAFAQFRDKLAPGGVLAFETGNLGGVSNAWVDFAAPLHLPEHVYFFAERHVETMLRESGFTVLEKRRHSIVPLLLARRVRALLSRHDSTPRASHGRRPSGGRAAFLLSYGPLSRIWPSAWPSQLIYIARPL